VQSLPKDSPVQPTPDEHLGFYKYQKQATMGNVKGNRPDAQDPTGMAMWDAWNNIKGTPKEAAWAKYVELLRAVLKSSTSDEAKKYTRQLDGA